VTRPIKVLLLGRKKVAANVLSRLRRDDRFDLRGVVTDSHLAGSPTVATALSEGVPVLDHQDVARLAECGKMSVDLVLSVLYWRRLKGSMLFPGARLGVINFHPAPLPEYKGCGGYNFAILDGLTEWATTAHYVDATIDTGAIIDVRRFPICPSTSTAQALERASMQVMEVQIADLLERIAIRSNLLPTQPNVGGRYISRSQMEAEKQIRPGDDVERKARAFFFPPYEGAWVMVNGVRCTVLPHSLMSTLAESGTTHLFTASPQTSQGPST
jgi:methionyl-tRNA formyltransferase